MSSNFNQELKHLAKHSALTFLGSVSVIAILVFIMFAFDKNLPVMGASIALAVVFSESYLRLSNDATQKIPLSDLIMFRWINFAVAVIGAVIYFFA